MKPHKESVLSILKHHTIKHTLIYMLILLVSLLLVKINIDSQLQKKITSDTQLKYQRDMGAFELLINTQSDALALQAKSLLEPSLKDYHNFSEEKFIVMQLPESTMARVYVFDRISKQLTTDFYNSVNQSIVPVFDFYDRMTDGFEMQKKGISVGILEDPVLKPLAYGYLMMTSDQRYYILVTLGLEASLESIFQSTYAFDNPPYELMMQNRLSESILYEDQRSIQMPLEEASKPLMYGFVSQTGYSFLQFAQELEVVDIPFKRPAFFMETLILIGFAFVGVGYMNYRNLKKSQLQLTRVSQLFDKNPLTVEDIELNSFDVSEIRDFMSVVKDVLQNIDSLLLGRQEQHDALITKNNIIQAKRRTMSELRQASLKSSEKLTESLAHLKMKTYQSLKALMYAIEIRDSYTRGHSDRVEYFAEMIASQMNISIIQIENVKYGALLHDVGKIGIRETVLNKSINVTLEDTEEFKMHPRIGYNIVDNVELMDEVKCIVLQHHERMDGTGYPQGLVGEQIHPLARIVAVADAYDAMTSNRPYRRNPLTRLEAIQELQNHSGSQFDKDVVRVFIDYLINEEQKG